MTLVNDLKCGGRKKGKIHTEYKRVKAGRTLSNVSSGAKDPLLNMMLQEVQTMMYAVRISQLRSLQSKYHNVSATQTWSDRGRNVTPHMRFQGVRGQRPEPQRARITTRHIDAKPRSERQSDTQTYTQTDSWKYPQQYYYSRLLWSKAHGAGCEHLPKRQREVRCDSSPNFGMNSVFSGLSSTQHANPLNNPS